MPEIADALSDVGITSPFPIQEMTLSVALMGTDLIGQARTGTGKTLAFAIPVVQRTVAPHDPDYSELAAPGKPQALILTPTRELTIQVAKDVDTASVKRGTRNLVIYGGDSDITCQTCKTMIRAEHFPLWEQIVAEDKAKAAG